MAIRVGINGFGRMGRLVLRAGWDNPELEFVHINEIVGGAELSAHLLNFDSIHRRWSHEASAGPDHINIESQRLNFSAEATPGAVPWADAGVDIVLECTGAFRTWDDLEPYYQCGVKKVIVAAPVKEGGALNIVMGINDHEYQPERHHLLTAASCTTNCLAPVVKVIHEGLGVRHGVFTTIHDLTNTQVIVDKPHKDPRRARSSLLSMIPTSSGSATAITMIYPELKGRLNGLAVRVPILNSSISDCVFEVERSTTREEVCALLETAAAGPLKGILGFEERPLVSVDYASDPRSSIVDGPTVMVNDETQVKLLAWYDSEFGYVQRMAELAAKVARAMSEAKA